MVYQALCKIVQKKESKVYSLEQHFYDLNQAEKMKVVEYNNSMVKAAFYLNKINSKRYVICRESHLDGCYRYISMYDAVEKEVLVPWMREIN